MGQSVYHLHLVGVVEKYFSFAIFFAPSMLRLTISKWLKRIAVAVLLVLTIIAGFAAYSAIQARNEARDAQVNAENKAIEAVSTSARALFASNKQLEALIEGIKAGKMVKEAEAVSEETRMRVILVLMKIINEIREYNRLEGHTSEVMGVSFSPDGQLIASASYDRTIKLWEQDGELLQTLPEHNAKIFGVIFHPDAQSLLSVSSGKTIKLWQRQSEIAFSTIPESFDIQNSPNWASFSPDGKTIVIADPTTVKLLDLNGQLISICQKHREPIMQITFSPDGSIIASASRDGKIKLWSIKDNRCINEINEIEVGREVYGVCFVDEQTIASGGADGIIDLWHVDGSRIRALPGHTQIVRYLKRSPKCGKFASAGYDRTVIVWNSDGTTEQILEGHEGPVSEIDFSPDGKIIASASVDETVKLWKIDGITSQTLLEGSSLSFYPGGQMLVSGSQENGNIRLYQQNGRLLKTFPGKEGNVLKVRFSPDGQHIASLHSDESVKLWNRDGQFLRSLISPGMGTRNMAFSHGGQIIATAGTDRTIKLWNLNGGKPIYTLKGHTDEIRSINFSPDGRSLVSGSKDKTVRLWDTNTGELLYSFEGGHTDIVFDVCFSPDSSLIASSSSDKTIRLWEKSFFVSSFERS